MLLLCSRALILQKKKKLHIYTLTILCTFIVQRKVTYTNQLTFSISKHFVMTAAVQRCRFGGSSHTFLSNIHLKMFTCLFL